MSRGEIVRGPANHTAASQPNGTALGSATLFVFAVTATLCAALLFGPRAASADPVELPSIEGHDTPAGSLRNKTLAVDEATGDIYVVDVNEPGSVEKFDSAGHFLGRITDANTVSGTLGVGGAANAVAVDNSGGDFQGRLYLTSFRTNSIYAFEPNGKEVWEHLITDEERNTFALVAPIGVSVSPSGIPWVTSAPNGEGVSSVVSLDPYSGTPTGKISAGTIQTKLFAFDTEGNFYTTDNDDINEYQPDGTLIRTVLPEAQGNKFAQHPEGIAVNPANASVFTATYEYHLENSAPTAEYGNWLREFDGAEEFAKHYPGFEEEEAGPLAFDGKLQLLYVSNKAERKIEIYAFPYAPQISATAGGAVKCDVGFGPEPCGEYTTDTKLIVTPAPSSGYSFAGWLGCEAEEEDACEVTLDGPMRLRAVFVREGTGVIATPEPAGENCTNGGVKLEAPSGTEYVCNGGGGAPGKDGAAGTAGAAGAQGPQGPPGPEGKVKVTCKVVRKKVKCTVKSSSRRPSARRQLRWSLHRAGHTVSHGTSDIRRLDSVLSGLHAGKYSLHIDGETGSTLISIG